MEGRDIKAKLGASKKEHLDAALKKIKQIGDVFKSDIKEAKHGMDATRKKLEKIMP